MEEIIVENIAGKTNFIEKAKKKYGDYYNYSKVKYVNSKTKVIIICPVHSEFTQIPSSHLLYSCKKCSTEKVMKKLRMTTEEFTDKAKQIHGDYYDYSQVQYVDNKTKVIIICPLHSSFKQSPKDHLRKGGCKKCGYDKVSQKLSMTTKEFVKKSKQVDGNTYDYSKV